jgi:hypothetical protein
VAGPFLPVIDDDAILGELIGGARAEGKEQNRAATERDDDHGFDKRRHPVAERGHDARSAQDVEEFIVF